MRHLVLFFYAKPVFCIAALIFIGEAMQRFQKLLRLYL